MSFLDWWGKFVDWLIKQNRDGHFVIAFAVSFVMLGSLFLWLRRRRRRWRMTRCWCGREAKHGKTTCGYHLPPDDPAKAQR